MASRDIQGCAASAADLVLAWVDRGCRDLADRDLADRECADLAHREWHPAVSDAASVARLGDVATTAADRRGAGEPKDGRMVAVPMVVQVADPTDLAVTIVVVPKVVAPMVIAVTVGPIAAKAATVPVTVAANGVAAKKTKRFNSRSRQTKSLPGHAPERLGECFEFNLGASAGVHFLQHFSRW